MATKKVQILGNFGGGSSDQIYVQNSEPAGAADGSLWLDLDEEVDVEQDYSVLYTGQTLTAAQKAQVRSNIEAVSANDTVANSLSLGGKSPEYYLQPVNMLDNSNFIKPINQRGQTTYIHRPGGRDEAGVQKAAPFLPDRLFQQPGNLPAAPGV